MSTIKVIKAENESAENFYKTCNKQVFPNGFSYFGPEKYTLRTSYQDNIEEIINFSVRKNDVFIISFPKCGSTWVQEMVWLIGNNLDFVTAKKVQLHERVPFLGAKTSSKALVEANHEIDKFAGMEAQRFIKTHLPYTLLPTQVFSKKPKIIYVVRNSKDTCVSYFHFFKLAYACEGTLEDFCNAFITDNVPYAPPFWSHIKSYWEVRHLSNLLIFSYAYEEMKKDLRSIIHKTAKFLDKSLPEDQIEPLLKHLSFESMQKNPAVNLDDLKEITAKKFNLNFDSKDRFLRTGQIGTGSKEMSAEMSEKFDIWKKNNYIPELFDI